MSEHHHVASEKFYFQIFALLLVLLVITVLAAYIDLGALSTVLAMTIAIIKALLVILYFMHVRDGSRLTWVFSGAAFFWLLILLGLTMSDYLSRGWIQPSEGWEPQAVTRPFSQEPASPGPAAASHESAQPGH